MAKAGVDDVTVDDIAWLIERTREKPLPRPEPFQFHKPGEVVVAGPSRAVEFTFHETVAVFPKWFVEALDLTGNRLRDHVRKNRQAGTIWQFLADAKQITRTRGLPAFAVLWLARHLDVQIAIVRDQDRLAIEEAALPKMLRRPDPLKTQALIRAKVGTL